MLAKLLQKKIGAMPSEIIFTSGASEANNMALKGLAFQYLNDKCHIITSAIEHKCILNTCSFLEKIGFDVTYISPNEHGEISPEKIKRAIREDTKLISIHHVNNELGTIQPIAEIGAIAFEHDILFHTDTAQSFCKLDIDVDDMNVDMLSLSGHKIYGPKGIGALYIRDARYSDIVPLIHGGGQELGLRGGTSPTPLIVGLAVAIETFPKEKSYKHYNFEEIIKTYRVNRNGGSNFLPTIWSVTFINDDEVKSFFNQHLWYVSQGSACNSITNISSHVLSAIGLDKDQARRTYRISLPSYYLSIC
ncbi:cysteine desulfurase family protein [Photobacterium angustum]|uniref:cysteine desulfurase family protein n=1 Tax=Photobacterium angustum TaxID=661 RepID=UPI000A8CB6BB|nr:cysteine desulfurase family protein [Photobacterium angustum]